jgi:predicted ATPase
MRITFGGAASTGKSTLVKAFLQKWPMYTTPEKTYRDVITESNLSHSSNTSEETQLIILDFMMKQLESYPKKSNVVFDRSPWDNLAYTLQGNARELVSDEVCAATISLVRESLKNLDIIFWIKSDPSIIPIVPDNMRDTDPGFIAETDQIFADLYQHYCDHLESDIFYPSDDCPAIIQIDSSCKTVDDRLWFIGEFLDYKGDLIETSDSILDPSNVDLLEKMLGEQQIELGKDAQLKSIMNQLKTQR